MEQTRHNKIDYVEFTTTDIEATKRFYSRVFGWSFTDYGPEYTSFSDGRIAGGFRKGEGVAGAGPLVVISVDDLNVAEQRVRESDGAIVKDPFSFPGGSRFEFRDQSGNVLAVWQED